MIKPTEVKSYAENIFCRGFSKVEAIAYATNNFSYFSRPKEAEKEAEEFEKTVTFKNIKTEILNNQCSDEYNRWNKDMAAEFLVYLANKGKYEIQSKGITLPRVTAVTSAVKELNTLYNLYNDTTTNFNITFVGEDTIK